MFDTVRDHNDNGQVGYMRGSRRLDVLSSRRQEDLFVIADVESIGRDVIVPAAIDEQT